MHERTQSVNSLNPSEGSNQHSPPPDWHAEFLKMVPKITDHASYSFRHLKGDNRDEMVQEVVTNALKAYVRLVEQGRSEAATWSSLARYAVRQVCDGRQVGTSLNIRDLCSRHCQIRKGVSVRNLSRWDDQDQEWKELIVEDSRSTPADVAAFRIDFREFLRTLSRRNRKLALRLAKGHATSWIARKFKVSAGRVSQLRLELYEAWQKFQADPITI